MVRSLNLQKFGSNLTRRRRVRYVGLKLNKHQIHWDVFYLSIAIYAGSLFQTALAMQNSDSGSTLSESSTRGTSETLSESESRDPDEMFHSALLRDLNIEVEKDEVLKILDPAKYTKTLLEKVKSQIRYELQMLQLRLLNDNTHVMSGYNSKRETKEEFHQNVSAALQNALNEMAFTPLPKNYSSRHYGKAYMKQHTNEALKNETIAKMKTYSKTYCAETELARRNAKALRNKFERTVEETTQAVKTQIQQVKNEFYEKIFPQLSRRFKKKHCLRSVEDLAEFMLEPFEFYRMELDDLMQRQSMGMPAMPRPVSRSYYGRKMRKILDKVSTKLEPQVKEAVPPPIPECMRTPIPKCMEPHQASEFMEPPPIPEFMRTTNSDQPVACSVRSVNESTLNLSDGDGDHSYPSTLDEKSRSNSPIGDY